MAPKTISNIPIISGILLALLRCILTITAMPIGAHSLSVRLIPIANLFPKNLNLEERHYKLVEISKNHARHLQQRSMILRNTTSALTNSANSTGNSTKELARNTIILQPSVRRNLIGYYIAQVSIGSKPFPTYMLIDSGSDLSWVQCEGCQSCFPLSGSGNFKHTQSQSFRYLPCNHSLCSPKMCDQHGLCRYHIEFMGSSTQGMVLTDSFTFATNSRITTAKYPGLAFGCGLVNVNMPFGLANNVIAGVLGLGLQENSILVQLEYRTKRRFSYCLPPLDLPTSLNFGDEANIRGSRVQEAPLVRGMDSYYVRDVLGISLEKTFLNIRPDVFRLKRDKSSGFIVDSGCPYSYIVQSVYRILVEKMVQFFEVNFKLRPLEHPAGLFELCFNMTTRGKSYVLPSMTFHFRGANLVMESNAIFQSYGGNIKCLAFLRTGEDGPTLLGAFQQTNHRFLFDGRRYVMAFAPEKCA